MDKRPLRIVKIWKDDYPWDIRVEKISRTLVDNGHEVYLICRNVKKLKMEEVSDGIKIIRFFPMRIDFLNKIHSIPIFFNPFWLFKIFHIVRRTRADVILVRELPLVISGLLIGKILNVPTIYDMAENYPALWKDVISETSGNFILKNPAVAKLIEKIALKYSDHIIVVVEESKRRLLRKGIKPEKVAIVGNTPQLENLSRIPSTERCLPSDKFILLYVGLVNTSSRGLEIVLSSLKTLAVIIPNIYFAVVGSGMHLDKLKALAAELNIEPYVHFPGWVDHHLIFSYIHESNICIIPHQKTEHTDTTIPNKLFDYMSGKKPVIVSDVIPLKRIVEAEKCGIVFNYNNVRSFKEAVIKLWEDPSLRKEMGENGYSAVKKKYNWSFDSRILLEVIEKIGKNST